MNDIVIQEGLTLCAAVTSLKNGWIARRPEWPEWMYIESMPNGEIIIWEKPNLISTDANGKECWDHEYHYWETCLINDAISHDWYVINDRDWMGDYVLHRLEG